MDIINFFTEMSPRNRALIGILFVALTSAVISFVKSSLFKELLTGIFDFIGNKREKKRIDKSKGESDIEGEVPNTPIPTEPKEGYAIKETDIINHDLFNYVDFWIYNQIPSMILNTQYRTAVFRKYLHIYFKTYKDHIIDYIRRGDYKKMNSTELRRSLINMITDIIRHMEIEMKEVGIPDVIILKMKNILNDRINLTIDLINSICDSSFYDGEENYLKMYSFLNIVHPILDNTLFNIAPICNSLNGELAGLTIDGFTEPNGHGDK